MKKVLIVGGGFTGMNAARKLAKSKNIEVTLIDRRNHHLFQPLLYQVAMAGLSPAEIAVPIRSLLHKHKNVKVFQAEVIDIDLNSQKAQTSIGSFDYDYLILACGARHTYFGNDQWEEHAPGLKTLQQATEIRRRVLTAFELAEIEEDPEVRKHLLTFVIVGGGPTGVELAGAIGEMSRYTLARDFRNINPKHTRIFLVEGGDRIMPSFSKEMSNKATRDLEKLGVQVWTSSIVTQINESMVEIGDEIIHAKTVLWGAGVKASRIGVRLGVESDRQGRVVVEPDLTLKGHNNVYVGGDMANTKDKDGKPLPGLAPVALQQGKWIAANILRQIDNKETKPFSYLNKGQMATIGRGRAIAEVGNVKIGGFVAWLIWLVIHIYYLAGFRNKFFVVLNWAWSYLNFKRGARLIIPKEWKLYS